MILKIQTLGSFDITYDGESILKDSSRSYKIYRLFQYFITHKDKRILPETIIDNLYEDSESDDPKNVLRTQIYRLKKSLISLVKEYGDLVKYFNISGSGGYYSLELGKDVKLDIEEFEKLIALGEREESRDVVNALELYKKALILYKGPYLSENAYETWLVPVRNRYNMLYMKILYKVIEILESMDDNYGIYEICEVALAIEPYEESIHIALMEAMLRMGQVKNAISHYLFITSLLKKELGINPSPSLKNIQRKIQNFYEEKKESNIEDIKTKLEDIELGGALKCDFDYFKFLYNTEKRKGLRDGNPGFICLISIDNKYSDGNEKDRDKIVKSLSDLLEKHLRKGDVYTFWNDNQILILLNGAKKKDLGVIENRIKKAFKGNLNSEDYKIDINFQPLSEDLN